MEKKKIGTLCAEFYKSWSEFEKKYDEALAELIVAKVSSAHRPSAFTDETMWLGNQTWRTASRAAVVSPREEEKKTKCSF
jgi:hypothetical protein